MKKIFLKNKFISILLIITFLCLVIELVCGFSKSFSEIFSANVAKIFRLILGGITSVLPFSLGEFLVVLVVPYIVVLLIFLIILLVKKIRKRKIPKYLKRVCLSPIVIAAIVFILFTLTFGPSYHRYTLYEQFDYKTQVTEEMVISSFETICQEMNTNAEKVDLLKNGETDSGMNFNELCAEVKKATDQYCEKYGFLQDDGFKAKNIILSKPMTYTHISGVYSFFTGECNVNTNYPDFVLAYTIAHEYCHSRGIAPENECNFLAFAILYESDNPYLRYSALSNMILKIADTAYTIDNERYAKVIGNINEVFLSEYNAYRSFFKTYENKTVSKTAAAVNDTYLKSQGQESGLKSYDEVISLVANYFNK